MINNKEFEEWCNKQAIQLVNIRRIKQGGKTRIKLTLLCKKCNTRFDVSKDTLYKQKYPGYCTSCAHMFSAQKKRIDVNDIVSNIHDYGLTVITPLSQIKPRGKNNTYSKTIITVKGKTDKTITVNYNNLMNRIDYYVDVLNNEYELKLLENESRLECKVRLFLKELNVEFKQQYRFTNCRGKKYPLPFDFCLFYNQENILLIEVDGERHYDDRFVEVQKNDRTKDFYCKTHNIPLLRISYKQINDETYRNIILKFISDNKSSDLL